MPTRALTAALLASSIAMTQATIINPNPIVSYKPEARAIRLVGVGQAAPIFVDQRDWAGVIRAAGDLRDDIQRVTDTKPELNQTKPIGSDVIVAGTLGKSELIDSLVKTGKLDPKPIQGKWEASLLQVVQNPWPGVARALVIAGSDKRGTIYGIYQVSEEAGVSPWYWWADVPTKRQDNLYAKGREVIDSPAVKYRGIFLNDEAPSLTNWVLKNFGNYNHKFYKHVFELLLRLRANYLWPAMWNNCFSQDDPLNPKEADEYGIVMGTSHVEPMMRADKEWNRAGFTADDWNFEKKPEELKKFWAEGVERNKPYENIVTMAMRGKIDTPMSETANISLLEKIVAAQRQILKEHVNPDVTKIPQIWCLYKEVQEYYEKGMRVPDDVTLLWSDDNWGDIRRLPTPDERKRSGGAGIYYHFDYVGGPRNYKWINTNPIPKVWEQMNLAYNYGADRVWIVNVGDLKPMEFPMEFFLRMAWKPSQFSRDNLNQYTTEWAAKQFGPEHASEIAEIIEKTTRLNGQRKPELTDPTTYSLINYGEAERVLRAFSEVDGKSDDLAAKLPKDQLDAYFQLVNYPVKAAKIVCDLYVSAAKNALYASQGRASTNFWADHAKGLFVADGLCSDFYMHSVANGKWDHMMDQTHIGYTSWQQPEKNVMPSVVKNTIPDVADMGIAVEGSAEAWPGSRAEASLPEFDVFADQVHTIDVFNRGSRPFDFTAKATAPWVWLSNQNPRPGSGPVDVLMGNGNLAGRITEDAKIWVSIDWLHVPAGKNNASITFTQTGGKSVTVKLVAFKPTSLTRENLQSFIESNGYVSMEAEHFTRKTDGAAKWEKIDGFGRTLSAMSIFPVTAPSQTNLAHSPCLEYKMFLFDAGKASVEAILSPTLAFQPGHGLRYAIAFDNDKPQIIDAAPNYLSKEWETAVSDSVRKVKSNHQIQKPGYHTLKIWMVDPEIVLEKLVVDLGGVRPSYLGPPESFRSK